MADLIKIKGGSGDVPTLQEREPAYNKTEKALYIGTDNGNVKVGDEGWETRITTLEEKLTAIEESITNIIDRLDALTPSE